MAVIDLGYKPREWQRREHLALAQVRWGVLVVHRRAGKSILAIMQLIDRACKLVLPEGRYAYIAPELKQAKAIAWSYLKQFATKIPGTVVSEGELHVTLPNGARIRIYGADNPDALRGIYLDGVVLDEVSQLSADLWDSVIRPALSDRKGWALMMGTPAGINLLSERYFSAIEDPKWHAGLYSVDQTNAIDPEEVADLKSDMTDSAFRREFMCDFNASVDDILLSVADVEQACARSYMFGDFMHAPKILGVDVARQGADASSMIRRQGMMCWEPKRWQVPDIMKTADRVAGEINEWKPDAVFIDGTGGYGAGVIDRLRQMHYKVTDVGFGNSPMSDNFLNKRAEMWWDMAQWVKTIGQLPASAGRLKQDLCTPTYGHNGKGKMVLESKDSIKKRGLPSPDDGDALCLTFAYPVAPKVMPAHEEFQRVAQKKFNPLGRVASYR